MLILAIIERQLVFRAMRIALLTIPTVHLNVLIGLVTLAIHNPVIAAL